MIEKFVLLYAALILGTANLVAALGATQLEVYYSIFVIELLVLLELLTPFKKSLAKKMNPIAFGVFVGFIYIVAIRIIEILR